MPRKFIVPIEDVVNLLGLERNARKPTEGTNYYVRCPYCDTRGHYHLNINTEKDAFRCVICEKKGGVIDLYALIRCGENWEQKSSRKEMKRRILEELNCQRSGYSVDYKREHEEIRVIYPADDDVLDAVYRALLALPYFSLNQEHFNNLISRGLLEGELGAGLYASVPLSSLVKKHHSDSKTVIEWYTNNKIDNLRKGKTVLERYTKRDDLLAGFLVANDLLKQGIKLRAVPGFFKLGGRWCFRYIPGMLVPTISLEGKVVGLQVRRDSTTKSPRRYMTVSTAGLEGGPTENISRIHVARDTEIGAGSLVYLTEGPLKANVILSLLKQRGVSDLAVIAIQGVNNKKGLPELLYKLKKRGVKRVLLAFDMDKICNPNVYKATRILREIILDSGLSCSSLYWDESYAISKRSELNAECADYNLEIFRTQNPFSDVFRSYCELLKANIDVPAASESAKKASAYWLDTTKGFDDYLLSLRA